MDFYIKKEPLCCSKYSFSISLWSVKLYDIFIFIFIFKGSIDAVFSKTFTNYILNIAVSLLFSLTQASTKFNHKKSIYAHDFFSDVKRFESIGSLS